MTVDPNDVRLGLPSASGLADDVACAGRRQRIASLPPQPERHDPDAERGTRIHAAWQRNSTDELQDETEIDDYTTGIKFMDDVIAEWARDFDLHTFQELPREQRLYLRDDKLRIIFSGQMDRWFRSGPHLLVIDGKSGWGTYVPPSQRSWQLRSYAVLGWSEFVDEITDVRVAYVKPKVRSEPTDHTDYDLNDLQNSLTAILFQLWFFQQPEAPIVPGVQCRFCPAKNAAACPEAAAYALLPSVIAGSALTEKKELIAAVDKLAPADLVRVFRAGTIVANIHDAVKARLKGMSNEELDELGLKRGDPRKLFSIDDVRAAFNYLKNSVNLPEHELWQVLKFGNTDLVRMIKRKTGMTDKGAKTFMKQQLQQWSSETESDPALEFKE